MTHSEKTRVMRDVEEAFGLLLGTPLDCDAIGHVRLAYWMLKANLDWKDPGRGSGVSPGSDGRVAGWFPAKFESAEDAARRVFGLLYAAREIAWNDSDKSPLSTWLADVLWSALQAIEDRYDRDVNW